MKSLTINASQRESVGKKATKALRNAGQVPCVIYGGDTIIHFAAPEIAFKNLVYTPDVHTVVIALDNGTKINAILQDIQFHPVTDRILHIDFIQIFDDKPITVELPFRTTGNSRGVRNGGVLRYNLRRIKVKGLASKLPDLIEGDITELKIGNKLYVTDVASEDFSILHPENTVICMVKTSRTAVADDEEEETEGEATAAEAPAAEA
ncbi:50S ribosomal protein L25/general stress protein Ctc [Aquimarina sp. AD1]|uniref:50S ribosomal protein L25/general stress protein Ctc n=1 Tax=Aquimarina sp. (strain AD1) TaxID=1714848 RepID=UPI000E4D1023|nr:50S ribosomal protein L25/general stress protein Ctc [Aquimarina sp. AD1]AXT57646.1 50S ribosomal protein L25/general stress protein Ctc [Aquimarina sp. AD1]RKN29021.1 50S ribosomal protein L25/general stress protein Ctc [Aquimarina sp. AD1]